MDDIFSSLFRSTLFGVFAASLPLVSFSQAIDSSNPEEGGGHRLGTVVVTGVREDDSYHATQSEAGALGDVPLLNTPFSIDVISHELLVDQQASYLGDFLKNDPSASVGNVVVSFATLRGFSLGNSGFLLDGLGVGSLLDDGRMAMQSYSQVDVLKGASAFLYGLGSSTSLGGALNFIPKMAGNTPVHDVAVTYTSRSQFGVESDLGDRVGSDGQFGYRLNAGFKNGDTAVDDTTWRQGYASLLLDWQIRQNLSVRVGTFYVNNKWDGIQPFFVGASNADGSPVVPIPQAPHTQHNLGTSWNTFDQNSLIGMVRADWAINSQWSLTVQGAGGRNNRPYDGTQDTRYGLITDARGDIELFASQESSRVDEEAGQLLLHGLVDTGPLNHHLTLGASGSQEKNYNSYEIAGFIPGTLYGNNQDAAQPPDVPIENLPYSGKTTTSSFLISDFVDLTRQWSVLLGGRDARVNAYNADNSQPPGGSVSRFTPAAALMFKPSSNSMLYANFSQGVEAGGTAPDTSANSGQTLSPLITKQYEVGGKLDWQGMSLTAAIFDMRRPLQAANAQNIWVQNGIEEHRGVELLASGNATPDLQLVAGAMFLDAKQRNGLSPTDGREIPGVPKWTANLFGDYHLPVMPKLFVNAGAYFTGRQYFDLANAQPIPSWVRFDIGTHYDTHIAGVGTSFYFSVENLANRSYWQSALSGALTLGDPRTFKATARVHL
jgi:iron complex outermembrane recepter protein